MSISVWARRMNLYKCLCVYVCECVWVSESAKITIFATPQIHAPYRTITSTADVKATTTTANIKFKDMSTIERKDYDNEFPCKLLIRKTIQSIPIRIALSCRALLPPCWLLSSHRIQHRQFTRESAFLNLNPWLHSDSMKPNAKEQQRRRKKNP